MVSKSFNTFEVRTMMTETASPSSIRIVFHASMFLFAVPILTAAVSGLAGWGGLGARTDIPSSLPRGIGHRAVNAGAWVLRWLGCIPHGGHRRRASAPSSRLDLSACRLRCECDGNAAYMGHNVGCPRGQRDVDGRCVTDPCRVAYRSLAPPDFGPADCPLVPDLTAESTLTTHSEDLPCPPQQYRIL